MNPLLTSQHHEKHRSELFKLLQKNIPGYMGMLSRNTVLQAIIYERKILLNLS